MNRRIVLVAAVFLVLALVWVVRLRGGSTPRRDAARLQQLRALAGTELATLQDVASPLARDCKDKLTPGAPTSLLALSGWPGAVRPLPQFAQLGGVLSGVARLEDGRLEPVRMTGKPQPGPQLDVAGARYLLVTAIAGLTPPVTRGGEVLPAKAVLHTRVLALPAGQKICEGEVVAAAKVAADEQWASSAGYLDAIAFTPLAVLCDAGGRELCELFPR